MVGVSSTVSNMMGQKCIGFQLRKVEYYVIAESNAQVIDSVKTDSDDNKVRIPQSQTVRK